MSASGGRVGSVIVDLDADLSKYAKKLSEAKGDAAQLIKDIEGKTPTFDVNTSGATKNIGNVNTSVISASREFTNLGNVATATGTKTSAAFSGARTSIGAFAGALSPVSAGFAGVGLAVAGATLAVGKFAVDSVQEFANFQSGMNEVFSLLPGISQQAMDAMSAQVKQVAADVGILPTEVIPAVYQALSAGIPQDNVFEFIRQSAQAGIAGVSDTETAVDALSTVLNSYGQDVSHTAEVSDLMFTTIRLGKTTFGELGSSLSNVTPVAAAAKVQFKDVAAAMATMTAQGVPTAQATTQLRQLFIELTKDGSAAKKVFEDIAGTDLSSFLERGHSFAEALQLIEEYADRSNVKVSDLFGSVEAGQAALTLTGSAMATLTSNTDAMTNSVGATETAFEQMDQGAQRSFQKLASSFQTLKIETGEKLAPIVEDIATGINENMPAITQKISDLADALVKLPESKEWKFVVRLLIDDEADTGSDKLNGVVDDAKKAADFFTKTQHFLSLVGSEGHGDFADFFQTGDIAAFGEVSETTAGKVDKLVDSVGHLHSAGVINLSDQTVQVKDAGKAYDEAARLASEYFHTTVTGADAMRGFVEIQGVGTVNLESFIRTAVGLPPLLNIINTESGQYADTLTNLNAKSYEITEAQRKQDAVMERLSANYGTTGQYAMSYFSGIGYGRSEVILMTDALLQMGSAQQDLVGIQGTLSNVMGTFSAQGGEYQGTLSSMEKAYDALQDKQAAGITLTAQDQAFLDNYDEVYGRVKGGIQDATIQEGFAAEAKGQLMLAQDALNQAIARGETDLGPYQERLQKAQDLMDSADPNSAMATAFKDLGTVIKDDLVGALNDLMTKLDELNGKSAKPKVSLDTADFDADGTVTRDEVESFNELHATPQVGMDKSGFDTGAGEIETTVGEYASGEKRIVVQAEIAMQEAGDANLDAILSGQYNKSGDPPVIKITATADTTEADSALATTQGKADDLTAGSPYVAVAEADVSNAQDYISSLQSDANRYPGDGPYTSAFFADTASAAANVGTLQGQVNALDGDSFTVTAYANIAPALAAIATLNANMPHSPAKEGPFRVLPNWDALFDQLPGAAEDATGAAQAAFQRYMDAVAQSGDIANAELLTLPESMRETAQQFGTYISDVRQQGTYLTDSLHGLATEAQAAATDTGRAFDTIITNIPTDPIDWSFLFEGIDFAQEGALSQAADAFDTWLGDLEALATGETQQKLHDDLQRLITIRRIAVDQGIGADVIAQFDAQIASKQAELLALGEAWADPIVQGIKDELAHADFVAALTDAATSADITAIASGDALAQLQEQLAEATALRDAAIEAGLPQEAIATLQQHVDDLTTQMGVIYRLAGTDAVAEYREGMQEEAANQATADAILNLAGATDPFAEVTQLTGQVAALRAAIATARAEGDTAAAEILQSQLDTVTSDFTLTRDTLSTMLTEGLISDDQLKVMAEQGGEAFEAFYDGLFGEGALKRVSEGWNDLNDIALDSLKDVLPQLEDGGLSMIETLITQVGSGERDWEDAWGAIQAITETGMTQIGDEVVTGAEAVEYALAQLGEKFEQDLATAIANGTDPSQAIANLDAVKQALAELGVDISNIDFGDLTDDLEAAHTAPPDRPTAARQYINRSGGRDDDLVPVTLPDGRFAYVDPETAAAMAGPTPVAPTFGQSLAGTLGFGTEVGSGSLDVSLDKLTQAVDAAAHRMDVLDDPLTDLNETINGLDLTFADELTKLSSLVAGLPDIQASTNTELMGLLKEQLDALGLDSADAMGEAILEANGFTTEQLKDMGLSDAAIADITDSLASAQDPVVSAIEDQASVVTAGDEQIVHALDRLSSSLASMAGAMVAPSVPSGGGVASVPMSHLTTIATNPAANAGPQQVTVTTPDDMTTRVAAGIAQGFGLVMTGQSMSPSLVGNS